jgi:glycosyltransferase involved in cell wall biosynthesis
MNLPLVSFIIPYYNAGATINETIDSIFSQSYENFDIWLVNDGSTDLASIEKLKDFEGREKIKILNQENSGPSIARNKAILLSNAEFIIPLDADDKIELDTVSESIESMKENRKIGVVYGNLQFFGNENKIKIQETFKIEKQLLWNQIAVCCLVRKSVFVEVGLYDEYLSKLGLEDWEFWIRVGSSNWEFMKIEKIQFQIRIQTSSRTVDVANRNLVEIKKYVCQKHSLLWVEMYENMYYQNKMTLEMPDFKIGRFFLVPYRFLKSKIFNR